MANEETASYSMEEHYQLFYIDFLKLKPEHVKIIEITNKELITLSRNPCSTLNLSQTIRMDTRYTCKLVSKTVCK
ncbi:MAG: hypothetical protein J7L82_07440, partial [Staphylothermus sp.]|nr:hypothetical protein [Staphylothermus sp.]